MDIACTLPGVALLTFHEGETSASFDERPPLASPHQASDSVTVCKNTGMQKLLPLIHLFAPPRGCCFDPFKIHQLPDKEGEGSHTQPADFTGSVLHALLRRHPTFCTLWAPLSPPGFAQGQGSMGQGRSWG